ncbi:DNA/RNA nuclease SfsA [uncultured Fibrobacter sp.]|uniref:DNA/RNA nuclease SfsA n=1 Tax=uncultured Fibrobacter sp. TaxID=261512 RepID=UPI0025F4CCF1|nr:DNA/RNA nuclease SfsA [uncultured Fibrobacter sp.]
MQYGKIVKATFVSRPNRFIAHVNIEGQMTVVHVKNTGRCRELLLPGTAVYLEQSTNPARKTPYDLIAVEKVTPRGTVLVNMDSQAPNKVAAEWIRANKRRFPKLQLVRPEYTFGNSRFDFYIEFAGRKMLLEVKGVTLEHDGFATFPDAPTERGIKHLTELTRIKSERVAAEDGTSYECGVLFLIQMKGCKRFGPDDNIHPEFNKALRNARKAGVEIFVIDCKVAPDSLVADKPVTLIL